MSKPFKPIYIAGQTAAGKTSVALALAEVLERPIEIVNADAYQVYAGIEILSAAPTREEMEGVPHHLFGVLTVDQECDAATFASMARECIADVSQRAIPVIVGGSGLYVKAITHGLAPTPAGDREIRRELDALSLDELVARYRASDPVGASQTNLLNRRYVTRNLEICVIAGRPASEIKAAWQVERPDLLAFYLHRERRLIYERINQRTFQMFEEGVVEEVAKLPGEISATAEKAIGLRSIRSLLSGEMSESECIEEIQKTTRRFAKRQETWFRREKEFVRIEIDAQAEDATSVALRIRNSMQ